MSDEPFDEARRRIEAARRSGATRLGLSGLELRGLPPEIASLTALEALDLDNNQLTALPPEIASLTALQSLRLEGNRLASLPREIGQLQRLQDAAEGDSKPFTEGLFIAGNPLPPPYRRLIAPGQPDATRNVLAWLRGELDPETLPPPQQDSDAPDPPDNPPPAPPAQMAGPHFALDATGRLVFAPPEALDAEGNNLALLRALHPTVRALAESLAGRLGAGNAPHAVMAGLIGQYRLLIGQDLAAIQHGQLFAAGVLLEEGWKAAQRQIAAKELPALDEACDGELQALLRLHATMVAATALGLEAIALEERYRRTAAEKREDAAATLAFAKRLQNQPDIIGRTEAEFVLDIARQHGKGDRPDRTALLATGTVRNAAIVLTYGGIIGALPAIGATLGPLGVVIGQLAHLAGWEWLKSTRAFTQIVDPAVRATDAATHGVPARPPPAEPDLAHLPRFALENEKPLRRLAARGERFSWLTDVLDWLKQHSPRR